MKEWGVCIYLSLCGLCFLLPVSYFLFLVFYFPFPVQGPAGHLPAVPPPAHRTCQRPAAVPGGADVHGARW